MFAELKVRKSAETDKITTEAWVLHAAQSNGRHAPPPAQLRRESFTFDGISADEVLAEPLYGCWEGNMGHALERQPIDICKHRHEPKVVIGNAGVVRVLRTGDNVTTVREGDMCIIFCNAVWDKYGYPIKILGYDAPQTMGVLAKQMKLHQCCLIPIPKNTRFSLAQWAAFSLRCVTAWANWHVTLSCFRAQLPHVPPEEIHVWGWGGGVSLAELDLATRLGYQTAMVASSDERLALIASLGIRPIDRREFIDLNFDEQKYQTDRAYKSRYIQAERRFLEIVGRETNGDGVSIFIDNVGETVYRATLKALSRQGVITTCGWKEGMYLSVLRAIEAIERHTHVHTHYARYSEGVEAVAMAEKLGWMTPPVEDKIYGWDEISQLSADYEARRVDSYFPIFAINA